MELPNLPSFFGNWAGPGYAGGTTELKPKEFVGLYTSVIPRGFLDNAAREHDAVYEYAERVYEQQGSESTYF